MKAALNRLFPDRFDNVFPGNRFALYVFYLLTGMTLWRSYVHMTWPDGGAQSIASMPLDTYVPGATANIIAIFGQWGLTQLLVGFLFLLVCLRYKSLMWLITIIEYGGRRVVGMFKPIETIETAPGAAGTIPLRPSR